MTGSSGKAGGGSQDAVPDYTHQTREGAEILVGHKGSANSHSSPSTTLPDRESDGAGEQSSQTL